MSVSVAAVKENGTFVGTYPSIKAAAEAVGRDASTISRAVSGDRGIITSLGLIWVRC